MWLPCFFPTFAGPQKDTTLSPQAARDIRLEKISGQMFHPAGDLSNMFPQAIRTARSQASGQKDLTKPWDDQI